MPPGEHRLGTPDNPVIGFKIREAGVRVTIVYTDMRPDGGQEPVVHKMVPNDPEHLYIVDPCDVAAILVHPSAGAPPADRAGPWYGVVHNSQWSSMPVVAVTERTTDGGTVREDHELRPGQTRIGEEGSPVIGYRIDGPDLATRLFSAFYVDLRTQQPAGSHFNQNVHGGLHALEPIHEATVLVYPSGMVMPPFGSN